MNYTSIFFSSGFGVIYCFASFQDELWLSSLSGFQTPSLILLRSIFKAYNCVPLFHNRAIWYEVISFIVDFVVFAGINTLFFICFVFCFCLSLSPNLGQRGTFSLILIKQVMSPFSVNPALQNPPSPCCSQDWLVAIALDATFTTIMYISCAFLCAGSQTFLFLFFFGGVGAGPHCSI